MYTDASPQAASSAYFVDIADQGMLDIFKRLERGGFNVFAIDSTQNLGDITQLLSSLEPESRYDSIHFYGHGSPGQQRLGADLITGTPGRMQTKAWRQLGKIVSPTADLLLYGCEAGSERAGRLLVDTLSSLSGMDVAASDDITGGNNWDLKIQKGSIESDIPISALQGWKGRLGLKRGVIIDTDWDIDDMNAIPSIVANKDVAAIVTTEGVSLPDVAADGLRALLSPRLGDWSQADSQIPIITGLRSKADLSLYPWLPPIRKSQARINDYLKKPFRPSKPPTTPFSLAASVKEAVKDFDKVDLLLIGPFTSFAAYSEVIKDRIGKVVIMGRPLERDGHSGKQHEPRKNEAFNCSYNQRACDRTFPLLVTENSYWVNPPDNYRPSFKMVNKLEKNGLPGGLRRVLLGHQESWNPAKLKAGGSSKMWDESAAQFLLNSNGFKNVEGVWEPAMGPRNLQRRWTRSINNWYTT